MLSPQNVDPVRNDWVFLLYKDFLVNRIHYLAAAFVLDNDGICHFGGDGFCLFASSTHPFDSFAVNLVSTEKIFFGRVLFLPACIFDRELQVELRFVTVLRNYRRTLNSHGFASKL